jgi:hypothetical protein
LDRETAHIPSDLSRLWQLAAGGPLDPDGDWIGTFEPVGLILVAAPKNAGYWCTPRNSVAFDLTPWDDPAERLETLEAQYRHMLDIPASPDA